MPRPQKNRLIKEPPVFTEFKAVGVPGRVMDKVVLSLDEYEALRLSDFEGMSQEEAADEMEISRPTFTRLIETSRKKICEMLVNGKMLVIDGGNIHFRQNLIKCRNCGHMFNINIEDDIKRCPSCGSGELMNLAGGFGHGRCCGKRR
ncbi:MAG: DUF134 domain-containing protein [Candidatus Delongbacteria bacterium]|jgi:predicted DNA-binding protein (UPF0251 family)|nr:DUF134 domain-containing protein [Candidatus Delongbacteria bacterium]MDD4206297.1 DUF134 domain-containing protein [Candidatus Delongbacteria bacterium]MDY0018272.1 DUF134 domain-containing protein [Candidatus Delongbacteria bacterium]